MQQLIILRHADAAPWEPTGDDFSRPLSARGTEHANLIAHYMTEHIEPPEQILCSSARRTRETLAPLLSSQVKLSEITRFDPQIYNARQETLIALLDFSFAEHNRVLIVGHNPGVSYLASSVIANADEGAFSGLAPGTLVVVDFDPGWDIGAGQGRLNRRVTYRDLSVD